MWVVLAVLVVALALGHLALWTSLLNRLHGTGLPRPLVKTLDLFIYAAVLGLPILFGYLLYYEGRIKFGGVWGTALATYFWACLLLAQVSVLVWLYRRKLSVCPSLVSNHTDVHDTAAALKSRPVHGFTARVASSLPRNEILKLHVNVKTLRVPRLPAALQGMSIVHLSDIHMCGKITEPFFHYVVDRANELDGDLLCITGDIVEKTECLPWIKPTLGRLTARRGKFFVLGNHDKRLRDPDVARRELTAAGLVDLGGRWQWRELGSEKILLAGDERPWFRGPDYAGLPPRGKGEQPFRLLLGHTPDVVGTAREHDFDLMLAGHCHGGQICFPFIGPIVSPSRFGVKYASGLFREGNTLLHVSRGISGLEPLRFNCPPELTKLVLVSG